VTQPSVKRVAEFSGASAGSVICDYSYSLPTRSCNETNFSSTAKLNGLRSGPPFLFSHLQCAIWPSTISIVIGVSGLDFRFTISPT
jgi:hypothetical protein